MRAWHLRLRQRVLPRAPRITRCYVQIAAPDSEQGERVVATYFFGRAAYLADCVPVAKDLESMDMDDMPCKRVLEAYEADRSGDD